MWLAIWLACVGDGGDDPGVATGPEGPTWHQDIAPIVVGHCTGCHTQGGIAPFTLADYSSAAPMASVMASAVEAGIMPPWGARTTDECEPRFGWKDDLSLTDADKALLRAWADAGAPEGDPATAAPLPQPPAMSLEDADEEVMPLASFTSSGDDDQFVCFTMDPQVRATRWLTGVQVVPGNAEVVHHVLVFSDPAGISETLGGELGRYDCFGGVGIESGALLAAWAPGALPFEVPEGTGLEVPRDSRLVMQVHYHPSGDTGAEDLTRVQLRWSEGQPEKTAVLALIGNASDEEGGLLPGPNDTDGVPEFRIPANVAGHTEEMAFLVEEGEDVYPVFLAGTHMHYVGTDMIISVEHAEPRDDEPVEECLVQTPAWDFDWQRGYAYDAPLDQVPQIRKGDTLRMRCTYDNTTSNPGVQKALADAGEAAPVDVHLGETTLDEMCLGVFGVVY